MNWREHEWKFCHSPVDELRVQEVESALGFRFPEDFRDCIKYCHGGHPVRNRFDVKCGDDHFVNGLGVLFGLEKDGYDNILDNFQWTSNDRPPGVIPIGEDGGGDLICLHYEDGNPQILPNVVYWNRTGPTGSFAQLASNFSEFLGILRD